MALELDFAKLTPQDVLDLALFAEREAEEGYDRLAALMRAQGRTELAAFFTRMAAWERGHQDKLAERRQALYPSAPSHLADRAPWGIELPDDAAVTASLTPARALELARDAEVSAYQYYTQALEFVAEQPVAEVFELLRKEELGHQRLLEGELAKL
ncbi:MAG: ferritin family protein [Thermoanaerobaculaceae bacterium]|nr:ferritin family protein [Thermoanaerobaculaceae bacterium]